MSKTKLPSSERQALIPPGRKIFSFGRILAFVVTLSILATAIVLPMEFVMRQKNGEFLIATYRFLEDDFAHPQLKRLRKREHLDQVIAPGKTEFDKIILLRHWVHGQWKSASTFFYPPWDAVEILDLARHQKNYGFCAQYAIVFLQACQSLGIHARYVELDEHFIVGVWSDEYNMWVVMDPTNDIYYEKDRRPLGGGELCRAYWTKQVTGISAVGFDGQRKPVTLQDIGAYKLYSIVKTADQLTHPVAVQVNGGPLRPLSHEDDFTRYPLVGRDHLAVGSMYLVWKPDGVPSFTSDKPMSNDRDEFRYKENQTMIFVARTDTSQGMAKVLLRPENASTFDGFLYSVNNSEWKPTKAEGVYWALVPGMNSISARVVTHEGWQGPVSTLSIYYKPAYRFFSFS